MKHERCQVSDIHEDEAEKYTLTVRAVILCLLPLNFEACTKYHVMTVEERGGGENPRFCDEIICDIAPLSNRLEHLKIGECFLGFSFFPKDIKAKVHTSVKSIHKARTVCTE